MRPRIPHALLGFIGLSMLGILALPSLFLAAQTSISAGPPLLYQVRTIYVAPSSDDFVRILESRLEKWGAVNVTGRIEEADAILTCETESRIIPGKAVLRQIDTQVRLVDRSSGRLVWSTRKSGTWGATLADDIVDQLKKDRDRSLLH